MTMFNEAELIRQLEEQRAVIVQLDSVIQQLQSEVAMLTKALKSAQQNILPCENQHLWICPYCGDIHDSRIGCKETGSVIFINH